ncbi:hypothetical protein HNQ69_001434 [Bartonella callosciuri]|uniref:Uncharacterized protein n=1 Tax=Bartonella callosciuri TaxID=686223 RepID=A0A840P1Z0_9HYPH|nr:hypothetical protein [Bartonella callosciuri]
MFMYEITRLLYILLKYSFKLIIGYMICTNKMRDCWLKQHQDKAVPKYCNNVKNKDNDYWFCGVVLRNEKKPS